MTNRRGFLSAILAGAAAPAVVSASSLMKLVPTESGILTYKMSGRYDLNEDSLERMMRNVQRDIDCRPSKIIVPATLMAEALKIIHAEFDKAYSDYYGKQWGTT